MTANPPAPTPSVTRAPQTRPAATPAPQTGVTPPPATPDATWPIPSQSTRAAGGVASASTTPPSAGPTSTVLTSPGGTVLADCVSAGAYLVSWSPTQGYEAGNVVRGPAAIARVTFTSYANSVTMVVSCSAGVPTATSYVQSGGGGGGRDE